MAGNTITATASRKFFQNLIAKNDARKASNKIFSNLRNTVKTKIKEPTYSTVVKLNNNEEIKRLRQNVKTELNRLKAENEAKKAAKLGTATPPAAAPAAAPPATVTLGTAKGPPPAAPPATVTLGTAVKEGTAKLAAPPAAPQAPPVKEAKLAPAPPPPVTEAPAPPAPAPPPVALAPPAPPPPVALAPVKQLASDTLYNALEREKQEYNKNLSAIKNKKYGLLQTLFLYPYVPIKKLLNKNRLHRETKKETQNLIIKHLKNGKTLTQSHLAILNSPGLFSKNPNNRTKLKKFLTTQNHKGNSVFKTKGPQTWRPPKPPKQPKQQ